MFSQAALCPASCAVLYLGWGILPLWWRELVLLTVRHTGEGLLVWAIPAPFGPTGMGAWMISDQIMGLPLFGGFLAVEALAWSRGGWWWDGIWSVISHDGMTGLLLNKWKKDDREHTQYIVVNYILKANKYVIRPVDVYWSYKVINLPFRHIQKINYSKNTAETTGLPEIEKGRTSSQTGSRALSFCMLDSMAEVDVMEGDGWLNISLSCGNSAELNQESCIIS